MIAYKKTNKFGNNANCIVIFVLPFFKKIRIYFCIDHQSENN